MACGVKERGDGGGAGENKDGDGGGGRRTLGEIRGTDTDGFQGGKTSQRGDLAGDGDERRPGRRW